MFVWNLPNLLTVSRILLAGLFLGVSLSGESVLAFWIFVTAAVTDMVDGAIARLFGQKTRTGAFLDPVADKILMAFGFVVAAVQGYLPVWLTALVLCRDFMIGAGVFFVSKVRGISLAYRPLLISKVTTLCQIVTLSLAMLNAAYAFPNPARGTDHWVTAFFTVASAVGYVRYGRTLLKVSHAQG